MRETTVALFLPEMMILMAHLFERNRGYFGCCSSIIFLLLSMYLSFSLFLRARALLFCVNGAGKDTRGGRGRNGKGGGGGGNKQSNGINKSSNKKGSKGAAVAKKGGGGTKTGGGGKKKDAGKPSAGAVADGERLDNETKAAADAKEKMELELAKIEAQALLYAEKRQDRPLEEAIIAHS